MGAGLVQGRNKEIFRIFPNRAKYADQRLDLWGWSMGSFASSGVFVFDKYRLDRRRGGLFREAENGGLIQVALGSRALDILTLLLERRGDLLTKEEIFTAVWPRTFVDDSNLTVQIAALRRVLDQGRAAGSFIQTISGHGYRFVAEAMHRHAGDPSGALVSADTDPIGDAQGSGPAARARSPTGGGSRRWQHLLGSFPAPTVIGDRRLLNRATPPHLSLVVLPFSSFGGRADQQCFADQITEELTTALSRFNGMRVVSRTTAFVYRNKALDARQIGRELNARYLLEGSVQRFSDRVRVNVHLIDAQADTHLWAQRFDHDAGDPLALQDETTKRTAVALYQALVGAEAGWPTEDPDAVDYILRGRAAYQLLGRDSSAEAISLLERALAIDPHSPEAQAWLAEALALRAVDGIASAPAPR
jgi:TolB-like protein/DNA-binding winged helix-turn-helix (wHTH) protein